VEYNSSNPAPKKSLGYWAFGVLLTCILVDQWIKIYVKTHFIYGESFTLFPDWFKIYFIENEGMAFGMKLFGGGKIGKLILTFFRITVSAIGILYLIALVKQRFSIKIIIPIALVLAGALGNIIDSIFYGWYFHDMNGYTEQWFEGHVVDMFYAPLWEGVLPTWIPFSGGEHFVFFAPIWNFADACITVGVSILLFVQSTHSLPSIKIIVPKSTTKQDN
jgi:signal peptidase II